MILKCNVMLIENLTYKNLFEESFEESSSLRKQIMNEQRARPFISWKNRKTSEIKLTLNLDNDSKKNKKQKKHTTNVIVN